MPKQKKERNVQYPPPVVFFKPRGVPMYVLKNVVITVDEYEAIRLSDLEDLKHDVAALEMNVSRPTFTRLIQSAHKKIAEALIEGKAIIIEGGSVALAHNRFTCKECFFVWNSGPHEINTSSCPQCGSANITDLAEQCGCGKGRFRKGRDNAGRGCGSHNSNEEE